MTRRCDRCKEGIIAVDGDTGEPYVICALIPPEPLLMPSTGNIQWVRPSMKMRAWCGQYRFSIRRLFGYGPRA